METYHKSREEIGVRKERKVRVNSVHRLGRVPDRGLLPGGFKALTVL